MVTLAESHFRTLTRPWLMLLAVGTLLSIIASALAAPLAAANLTNVSGPAGLLRDHDGRPLLTRAGQLQSTNWSGYALISSQTGQSYTSATGTWIVPATSPVSGFTRTYSSSWVGIGGVCATRRCTSAQNTLIQLGTESDNLSGKGSYYSWYEMLPAAAVKTGLVVHPGDSVTAGLQDVGPASSGQTWNLTLTNNTTGLSWSKTVTYNSGLSSAEWIMEAPASRSILPLTNYGTAQFDPGTINGGQNPELQLSNSIVMVNSHGMSSNPSSPDSDTDGFDTCWGATSTPAPCSPPAS